jgi:hypothetical protein
LAIANVVAVVIRPRTLPARDRSGSSSVPNASEPIRLGPM